MNNNRYDAGRMDMSRLKPEGITAEEIIAELPKGLIKWYSFDPEQKALYITGGTQTDQTLYEAVKESGMSVDLLNAEEIRGETESTINRYDCVILSFALEQTKDMNEGAELLSAVSHVLKADGKLFMGLENRLGIRYFCGDRDKYTGRNFDGIENYVRANPSKYDRVKGRCYAKDEIQEMLRRAGFLKTRFFSVLSGLECPQVLLADDYTPNEQLDIRIFPQYHYAETVFLEEEMLYGSLLKNGMFHPMANAFWIEASINGELSNVNQVTMSMNRGRRNAMFTVIRKDGYVEKKAVYAEGKSKLKSLMDNTADLETHGLNMVKMELKDDVCIMPYIHAQSALEYLRDTLFRDKDRFLEEMDRLWELILHSSDHVPYNEIDWDRFEPGWENMAEDNPLKNQWKDFVLTVPDAKECIGVILKRGYIDLIPLNSFYQEGEYIFCDQEMYVDNLPAKVIMARTIDTVYLGNWYLNDILPRDEVRERYHILHCKKLFDKFSGRFLTILRNDRILRDHYKKVRKNLEVINSNRQRMNYSANEYDMIFRDIFRGVEGRALYLFGTGLFAKRFLSQFGNDCSVVGMLDNNPDKWNQNLNGIPIYSPEILKSREKGTYKIIICIKNYMSVMEQLTGMGVEAFSIYDPDLIYTRPKRLYASESELKEGDKKKYNIGYIAGVFDLFHVGHLNMFRRAKEQCNYLIVGVVTDEGVIQKKHLTPFVPFAERIEIVRSCKYVDEAVEIPLEYYDTDEAYRRYQFDVQFSGSDYADSNGWLAKKEYLQSKGSDLIFFPYTQSTSSTQIKGLIDKKLI